MPNESPGVAGRRWHVPMRSREATEQFRTATPLELLFDLTFVVAVALLAAQLAHSVVEDHAGEALVGYLMVFFAIWWAWMNFTWFASAYDTDDVIYRLLTMVQMFGVLVLAAGVPAGFSSQDFAVVTLGYVIMRVAMLTQWLRAAASDPARRSTCIRYATGTAVVQLGWILRLLLVAPWGFIGFFVLVAAELFVPWWAERGEGTTWHPHHIAERYGLFTIIVLGECVLAATTAMQVAFTEAGVSIDLVLLGVGSLVLLFALWWFYFLKAAGVGLELHRGLSFLWGYGHYGVFAALAALGAGLEVAAEAMTHHIAAPTVLVAYFVAGPVAVVLVLVWALHAPLSHRRRSQGVAVLTAAVATLAGAGASGLGLPLAWVVLLTCVPVATLVAIGVLDQHRKASLA
ncbi:MAG: low temperature requirement protein A [Nocardioidaceae bacterium]